MLLAFVLLSGCKPTVDLKLVQQYQPPVNIEEDETLIYVIRKDTSMGMMQHLWVVSNDEYIANLDAGTYCYFKVPATVNTISLRQMRQNFAYQQVDFRPGETVFYYFDIQKNLENCFYELESDLGKTLIMSLEEGKRYEGNDSNTYFEMGATNPGLVYPLLTKESTNIPEPDSNNAVITFIRYYNFDDRSFGSYEEKFPFGIWSQSGLLGNLKAQNTFSVKIPEGKHSFTSLAEQGFASILKADLKSGMHYYVLVEVVLGGHGLGGLSINLSPIKNDVTQTELQKWIDSTKRVELNESAITANIQKRLSAALPYIDKVIKNDETETVKIAYLKQEDGR